MVIIVLLWISRSYESTYWPSEEQKTHQNGIFLKRREMVLDVALIGKGDTIGQAMMVSHIVAKSGLPPATPFCVLLCLLIETHL